MGESGRCVYNKIVVEPLKEENHEKWFKWVKNYLIAQDLWEVIDGTLATTSKKWRRKNAAALYVIRISCTPESFDYITEVSKAKVAWDILNYIYSNTPQEMGEQVAFDVAVLYEATCDNNWSAARAFFDQHPSALTARINASGQTTLHVAAQFGHIGIVEELVRLVSPEFLEIVDDDGFTPLAIAAYIGVTTRLAECIVNKNSKILSIKNEKVLLAVTLAFATCHKEMGRYLYTVTPSEYLKPENGLDGHIILYWCFITGDLSNKA